MSETIIHRRVAAARAGDNPTVIGRVSSGWLVLGDQQYFRGYSLVLPDPVVGSINDLDGDARLRFLSDMASIGDALLAVTDAWRINYSILGNADPALHAHVFPRYRSEPDDIAMGPVWCADKALRESEPFDAAKHAPLITALRTWLDGKRVLQNA